MPGPTDPPVVLGGRWIVVAEIGRGGEGAVFSVRHVDGQRSGAAKIGAVGSTDVEFKTLLDLHHENINPYRDAGTLGVDGARRLGVAAAGGATEVFWVVSDRAPGCLRDDLGTAAHGSAATRRMDAEEATTLLESLLAGLAYLHRRGIVHGDVKPANVLRFDGRATTWRLTDFGIATHLGDRSVAMPLGVSPGWTAPEVLLTGEIRPSADVYSLGQTVHMAVAGERASEGAVADFVPPTLGGWLAEMMRADPTQRPDAASMLELVRRDRAAAPSMETIAASPPHPAAPTEAGPNGDSGPVPPRSGRSLRAVAAIAALFAVIAGAGFLASTLVGDGGDPNAAADESDTRRSGSIQPSSSSTVAESPGSMSASTDPVGSAGTPSAETVPTVFVTRSGGGNRVMVVDPDDGEPSAVWGGLEATGPSITPDGATVAAIVSGDGGDLVAVGPVGAEATEVRTYEIDGEATSTAISPEGDQVAYSGDAGGSEGVYVIDLESGAVRSLADGSADEVDPMWSVDGGKIAYVRAGSSSDTVVVADAVSGTGVASFEVEGGAASPSIAPDGESIAYVADVAGNRDVFVAALDGSGATNRSRSAEEENGVLLLAGDRVVTSAPSRGLVIVLSDGTSEQLTSTIGDRL